jgi:tRNA pseudouridine65 synthase
LALIELLYRDADLAVAFKPAGVFTHPSKLDRRAGPSLMDLLRDQLGQPVFIIHRLDRSASGCLLVALNREAASRAGAGFRERQIVKTYWIVVRGWTEAEGTIDRALDEDADGVPKASVTNYRTLARVELPVPIGPHSSARYSWVEVKPETGRHHQIRRHFAGQSHPVLGDSVYGDGRHNRQLRQWTAGEKRLMLMGRALEFERWDTGARIRAEARPDPLFAGVLRKLFPEKATELLGLPPS